MADASTPTAAPRPRWLLIASLCLNAFLIALVVAGIWWGMNRAAFAPGASPLLPHNAARLLEGGGRDKVQELIRRHRGEFAPLMRATREARREAYDAFRGEPFDAARFNAAMDRVRAADAALAAATQAVILEMANRLSPDERAELVRKARDAARERRLGRRMEHGWPQGEESAP